MNLPISNDQGWKATTYYGYTMSVGDLTVTFTPRALLDARAVGVEKSSFFNPMHRGLSYFKGNAYILWHWLRDASKVWTVFTARDSNDNIISIGCGYVISDSDQNRRLNVERLFYYEIPE